MAGISRAGAQRNYSPHSVLSSGTWYKLAIPRSGVYKIDLTFLQQLGLNTQNLPSGSIRIFGNGGRMLPEDPGSVPPDDLQENAILTLDGGDGILNGNDIILFYGQGPASWVYDSSSRNFRHRVNLYSDSSYYYLSIGGEGKRMEQASPLTSYNLVVNSFDHLFYHEKDTFNLLSSGKEWFGEEFSAAPGKTLEREILMPSIPALSAESARLTIRFAARSFGSPSFFQTEAGNTGLSTEVPPVATGPYDLFARTTESNIDFIPSGNAMLLLRFTPGSINAQGWLDWLEVNSRRELFLGEGQLEFRDTRSAGAGNAARFEIRGVNDAGVMAWDITNSLAPSVMPLVPENGNAYFIARTDLLRTFTCFRSADAYQPVPLGRIANQDLHGLSGADYIIITHPSFRSEANRLADFHRSHNRLESQVVSAEEIFNEFSSGIADPTAIRDFLKMQFDRAAGDSLKMARYLLLFGDASFDYKSRLANNSNLVPAYESAESLNPLSTYTSDDYFGFLHDEDDINGSGQYFLDIGIGRIPAGNIVQAKSIVDKIIRYHSPSTLGPWRNEFTFVADDEDNNLHLEDAEAITKKAAAVNDLYNYEKVYLDAYPQEAGPAGNFYPGASQEVVSRMFKGNLLWNYNGHGGYRRLAEEVVLDQAIINRLDNADRLPLLITATCDVAPFDNPLVSSIGENILLREKTGAIALMTTSRIVFAFSNRVMNENYLQEALKRKPGGNYPSLGEAVKWAKNITYRFSGDVINNRKFTLLGDPAMTLSFPHYTIHNTSINGRPVTGSDTLRALSKYTISGEIRDFPGNLLEDFSGTVYPVLYEKGTTMKTLGNDPSSQPTDIPVQRNSVFRGSAKVVGGKFSYSFVVPKDIGYQFGNGRLTYYADNGREDANGAARGIIIGGTGEGLDDGEGPQIKAFLNDEKFISGGIADADPVLLLKVWDSSGINILGKGIGHDLVVMLDNDPDRQYILNNYYQAEPDNYQEGKVRFQLPPLEEGRHTLTVKAWDVANNSGEASLDFHVVNKEELKLEHVLNYPNPFTTKTTFWFDHNRPGEELEVQIQVFTVAGKLVKTIRSTIISMGNRSSEVEWDGKDDFGARIGRGVYIYTLRVQTSDGKSAKKIQKLYLL